MCVWLVVFIWCFVRFEYSFAANDVQQALTEKFTWKSIEFAWPSDAEKQDALHNGNYVPENNFPFSVDVWGPKLFIAVPRYCNRVVYSILYSSMFCLHLNSLKIEFQKNN